MLVILNVLAPIKLVMAKFVDQVSLRFIWQLIKGFSRFLQKLLKYINGTTVSTFFALPVAGILPPTAALGLNDLSLLCYNLEYLCYSAISFLIFFYNYHCTLLLYSTLALQYLDTVHYLLGFCLFH